MDIDASMNWFLQHWYYWLIAIMGVVLLYIYQDLQRLKNMYRHWTQERLKEKIKNETIMNPSHKSANWLVKDIYGTHKEKVIGKIQSFKELKDNPVDDVCCVVATRKFWRIPLGRKKIFHFNPKNVIYDDERKVIKIPYNYYWSMLPSGEFMLASPNIQDNWKFNMEEITNDTRTLAIDGYASQMASYSSVKPTWGHEERIMEKEGETSALGFGRFLKKKKTAKPKQSESDD